MTSLAQRHPVCLTTFYHNENFVYKGTQHSEFSETLYVSLRMFVILKLVIITSNSVGLMKFGLLSNLIHNVLFRSCS